jgi:hypothetical protein
MELRKEFSNWNPRAGLAGHGGAQTKMVEDIGIAPIRQSACKADPRP